MKRTIKKISTPTAKGLGSAMRNRAEAVLRQCGRTAILLLVMMLTTASTRAELASHIDYCQGAPGCVFITGWVYDQSLKHWQVGEEIEVSAFLSRSPSGDGWDARSGDVEYVVRDDVNTAYGLSGKHGFRMSIEVPPDLFEELTEMPLYVKIYATVNNGNGYEDILLNSPYTEVTVTALTTTTTTSTYNYDDKTWTLYSGFTATGATNFGDSYRNIVDGNLGTWCYTSKDKPVIEFCSGVPIIPKGFVYNCNSFPMSMTLKAKAFPTDEWTELFNRSNLPELTGLVEIPYYCNNAEDSKYQYFQVEVSEYDYNNPWVNLYEFRLFSYYYTYIPARAATCAETGISQDCYQRSDGRYFADEWGETELNEADVVIPTVPHTGVHYGTPDSYSEYWQCSVCGKYFGDAACTEEMIRITNAMKSLPQGRYVVTENVTFPDRISVSGQVRILLCDNTTLTASNGIHVSSGNTLQIDGNSTDEQTMGTLIATTSSDGAAIGGNGQLGAGTIIIIGGKIQASAGRGAGIGSGQYGQSGDIYLKGGVIIASSHSGSGIGSGYASGGDATVNISDGIRRIEASSTLGMAIGNGNNAQGTVTVNFYHGDAAVTGTDKDAVFYDTGEGSSRAIRTRACNHSINIVGDLMAHITPNTPLAIIGETVTLTLDYAVDETTLNVSDGTNNLTLTDKGNRQYSFVMPDGDVSVTATILTPHNITIGNDLLAHVTASAASAYKDETITLTLGGLVDETTLNVSDGTNNLTLTDKGNRQYSFVMPDGDVSVTATFYMADLRDGVAYDRTSDFVVATATYTKTLGSERVNLHQAWMVPFDYTITAADLQKFTFYKINMIANSPSPSVEATDEMWVFLKRMEAGDLLHANMPYVYKPKEAVTDYEFTTSDATLKAKNTGILLDTRTTEDIYSVYATYENTTATTDDPFYYVNINGDLSLGNDGTVTVGPYRWIIRKESKFGGTPQYARRMHFYDGEDEASSLNEKGIVNSEKYATAYWYTIDGRRIEGKPSKSGLYIVNGHKVVVK